MSATPTAREPAPRIELCHGSRLCYAMQQNAVPLVPLLRLHNETAVELRDLEVRVELLPGLAPPWTARVAAIAPGGVCDLASVRVEPRPEVLANVTERQTANLRVAVHGAAGELCAADHALEVLAYNEWPGAGSFAALLAAFVLPNHPALGAVLRDAAQRLGAATGSAALDGYGSRDPERVRAMAAAVHAALQARDLCYVTPPASFEERGQKVRTPEQVLEDGMGTCLDLAVLVAACFEQVGLHPLLVVTEGHALCGLWLGDEVFAEPAPADPLPLRKRLELRRLLLVECTALCATQARPFADACELGARAVAPDAPFLFAVDVAMARRTGIRPLAVRTRAFTAGEHLQQLHAPQERATALAAAPVPGPMSGPAAAAAEEGPAADPETGDAPATAAARPPEDRLARWQRRLLDLSLRNRLLAFAPSRRTLPLQTTDLCLWEEALQGGAVFRVHPAADLAAEQARLEAFLRDELQSRRLRSQLGAEELDRRLVEIWRQARTAHEESGVGTLFLAAGFLRWYETPSSTVPRRAPLLLLPLRIERVSVAAGFELALADEEPRVNDTLVQKLHHDFGIAVPGLETDDDTAPGLAAVLEAFRRAVVDVDRWEVETTAWIGCFSFAKYLMWADLAERRADLLEHPLLRHLVETPEQVFADGSVEWPQPEQLDGQDPAGQLCPLDADSSQLCAVQAAAAGRSFVLEGPPGTGKSQTITNLIAQCLGSGQRVLFVAEKRAALEVVQQRLAAVGLAPFCLELHSGKGSKRAVVQQLGRALDLAQGREPAAWRQHAAELAAARARLNRHVDAIHRRRAAGFSVFDATALLVTAQDLPMVAGLPVDLDAAALAERRELVRRLAATAAPLGDPRLHPWHGVQRSDWQPALGRELEPLLARFAASLPPVRAALAAAAGALGLPEGTEAASRAVTATLGLLAGAATAAAVAAPLLCAADFEAARQRADAWLAAGSRAAELWEGLASRWRSSLLDLDVIDLRARLLRDEHRFWPLRWWRLRRVRAALRAVAPGGAVPRGAQLHRDLEAAAEIRRLRQVRDGAAAEAAALLGEAARASAPDWQRLADLAAHTARVRRLADALARDLELDAPSTARLRERLAAAAAPPGDPALRELAGAHAELAAAMAALAAPLQLDHDRAFGGESAPDWLARAAAKAARWPRELPALREQCAFQRDAQAAAAAQLGPLVAALEDGAVATAVLGEVFERSFAQAWLDAVLQQEPELLSFRGRDHEDAIARFCRLDEQMIALAGQVVQSRLAAQLPQLRSTSAESSELGILLRELRKQRRHLSPRQLFQRLPNLLARLAPCLLMSPLTVAQVLGRRVPPFDLVVFDEASQVPVWDAVGAIGRGRALVVVGDPRQLPPTTFFQRLEADGEEDFDQDQVEELESVLDECGAAGLRRLQLRWHYRSRHESLIAFSNHHYYENRLLTFPAPHTAALGVRFVPVAGVYDRARSQTNRIEAEALVAELVGRLRDPQRSAHSHGVVTFSMAQQVLVEDLLDRARALHPEIERHFTGRDEPVFVKNLENVQGDERSVMLFSICYGPDAAGKVHMNFGPLNQRGGERRLNVAITRARSELLVFGSLRAEQIELQRTQSTGVRHLRAFLDYAVRGPAAIAAAAVPDAGGDFESPFERAVGQALRARGHEVHAQVGCSGYRVDLGVVDPRASGRYLLGVECDGRAYHSAATVRDRDRLRQAVLERLGWRIHRVWSTDWWFDPAGELERLAAAIEAALREAPAGPAAPEGGAGGDGVAETAAPSGEVAASATPSGPPDQPDLPVYAAAQLPPAGQPDAFFGGAASRKLTSQVAAVLAAEAPITADLLARRVAAAWGLLRLTDRVRERVRRLLPPGTVAQAGALWPAGSEPAAWTGFRTSAPGAAAREADDLPAPEVGNAMLWVLREHGSLGRDDLLRETARLFGFTRLGSSVRAAMERGLAELTGAGRAAVAEGLVSAAGA